MAYSKQQVMTILNELTSYWTLRKQQMVKNWDFYYGNFQRIYMPPFSGETQQEYTRRVDNASIENHCGKTCDVIVSYLYGQPNSRSRVRIRIVDEDGNLIENLQELFVNNIWEYNDMDSFRIDLALMSSVCGFSVVHKEFVDAETLMPFPQRVSKADRKKLGTIRYDLFDSVDTAPMPRLINTSMGDTVYPRILGGIMRLYSQENYDGSSYFDKILYRRNTTDDYFEFYDDKNFYRTPIPPEGISAEGVKVTPNPYGSISIPFTLFRNYGDPMYLEGSSDIAQMLDLQTSLNELSNDDKNTIHHHSMPLLAIIGDKMPEDFIRKANSILELSPNSEAKYVTWDNVLDASEKKQESIRRQMTVTSGVGMMSRGNATDIGQIKSGAGLKTLFQADINTIGLKIPHFRLGEKNLVSSTLQMWAMETGEEIPYYRVEVEFPEDFVGIDELLKAQTDQIEIETGIETIRQKVKERHPEVTSEEDLDEIVSEIMSERKARAKSDAGPANVASPDSKSMEQTKV